MYEVASMIIRLLAGGGFLLFSVCVSLAVSAETSDGASTFYGYDDRGRQGAQKLSILTEQNTVEHPL